MKINCTSPEHDDATASMEVYEDSGYCFSCGYRDFSVADTDAPKREPEDILSTIRYIQTLPTKPIRGLELPYDDRGYYIVWPDNSFYKLRRWDDTPRYQGPRGHQPQLFLYPGDSTLLLVEGEINAMTLKQCLPDCPWTISSPGAASMFGKHDSVLLTYHTLYIILDRDASGVAAGIDLKRRLLKQRKQVTLICLEKDFNDVFQEGGTQAVRQAFKSQLGL